MPSHVLYAVLREQERSRIAANWSIAFRETAAPLNTVGTLFLFYAIMGYIEPEGVDESLRNTQLSLGISFTGFGIVSTIISSVLKRKAVEHYNNEVAPHGEETGIEEKMPEKVPSIE